MLTKNTDFLHKQHKLLGLSNGDQLSFP